MRWLLHNIIMAPAIKWELLWPDCLNHSLKLRYFMTDKWYEIMKWHIHNTQYRVLGRCRCSWSLRSCSCSWRRTCWCRGRRWPGGWGWGGCGGRVGSRGYVELRKTVPGFSVAKGNLTHAAHPPRPVHILVSWAVFAGHPLLDKHWVVEFGVVIAKVVC